MTVVTVHPIRTEADYEAALRQIETLMTAPAGSPEGETLDVLVTLVQAYEARHHAIEAPDPIALLEHLMEARGLGRRDLEPALGPSGRVSEVLNRRRRLSLDMIRALHDQFDLPAEVLIREYPLAAPERAHGS
ncbi:helix-turn-helix domain-containing protein [Caenispirillum bisanense]|uniref:HTH-type transcriptional regulator / antitoxin HigA n=1 Tax=Caenispirillum bisanense TaxID=414052 RepID=A0A286H128_9PROT|nr:transcriptional regulator [Caenispirillum bisanense]SOE01422.1 HTH-type transcriptional regulator / antitoxin HigA [Caenispirillum bisanense]